MNQVIQTDENRVEMAVVRLDSKEWKWLVGIALGPAVAVVGALFMMYMGHRQEVDVLKVKQTQIILTQEKLTENQKQMTKNQTDIAVVLSKLEVLHVGQEKMERGLQEVHKEMRK